MRMLKPQLLLWAAAATLWALVAVDRSGGGAVPDLTVTTAAAPAADSAGKVADTAVAAGAPVRTRGGCIDVNRATAAELDALPGVGPAIAQRIIEYRSASGGFRKLADLDAVKGIGPAMLRKLEGKVCF